MAKRGPKERSVIERIRDNIEGNPNIGAALACFPADIAEHWIWKAQRSAQIWRAGKSEQVVRVLFEIACGEPLHDGRSPRRTCANPRCVNPTHYELIPYRTNRYGADAPLPAKLFKPPALSRSDEIAEVIELIDEQWPRPGRTEFIARMANLGLSFADDIIAEAYAQLAPA